MDRRDFLKVGGAAAAAVGTGTGQALAAPAILPDAIELRLASPAELDVPGTGADRLARRIEMATGGRYRIVADNASTDAELVFGDANRHLAHHPAFAYFAGLPLGQGMDAAAQQTWLAIGGGQMLWDELAASFGFKPLVCGHTGPSAGLWSARRLETVADLSGARMHVVGLAADVVRALGATPTAVAPADLTAALAEGRLDAAEWLGPQMLLTPDLQPLANRLYHPGLNARGAVLSLDVRKPAWDRLGAADQAIFEACAAEAYHLSLAEAQAHALIAAQVGGPAKWPVRQALSSELAQSMEQAAHAVVADVAGRDLDARRIHDSAMAFRAMLGEARTA